MITIALVGVSACEEVVISSILDRLMWGCPGAPCDPGLVVQGVAALGTEGCDVPLAQATGVDITDNCMVLDECCEGVCSDCKGYWYPHGTSTSRS